MHGEDWCKECFRASLCSQTSSRNASGRIVDSCQGPSSRRLHKNAKSGPMMPALVQKCQNRVDHHGPLAQKCQNRVDHHGPLAQKCQSTVEYVLLRIEKQHEGSPGGVYQNLGTNRYTPPFLVVYTCFPLCFWYTPPLLCFLSCDGWTIKEKTSRQFCFPVLLKQISTEGLVCPVSEMAGLYYFCDLVSALHNRDPL